VSELTPSEKLQITLDLCDLEEEMMRQDLRRRQPDEDEAAIERRLDDWFQTRPGAEYGDCEGRPIPWPRPRR
jgi:hypothetical protein